MTTSGYQPAPPGPSLIEQRSEHLSTSSLLAGAGGFLDAFTYIGHGHTFANAQTGNVVILGIELFQPDRQLSLHYLLPILMFLLGIWAARAVEQWFTYARAHLELARSPFFPERSEAVLAVECLILLPLAMLPANVRDVWITAPIAFAASMQVQTFRNVSGHTYNSTFMAGNLRSLASGLFDWTLGGKPERGRHSSRVFAQIGGVFLLGAVVGGVLTPRLGNRALFFELFVLLVVLAQLRLPGHLGYATEEKS